MKENKKMRAYALVEPGRMEWIDVDKPVISGDYSAILRPIAISPCSSDVHTIFENGSPKPKNWIMGHECLAEVVEVGKKVLDFKEGDKVLVPSITPDWRDKGIQEGNFTHPSGPFSGMKLSISMPGIFAEYFEILDADTSLVHLPEDVSLEAALMCVDVVTTGFTGVEAAEVKFGDTVCVLGIGPIGLMAVAGAKLRGAAEILAVGTRPVCVNLAKEFGATKIISYKEGDIVTQVLEATEGRGVDSAIIVGGNQSTFTQAVNMVCYGTGVVSNLNYYVGDEDLVVPKSGWGRGMAGKTIRGELCKGGRVRIERLLKMVQCGRIQPEKLITHTYYGFDELEKALFIMRDKPMELVKAMVIL